MTDPVQEGEELPQEVFDESPQLPQEGESMSRDEVKADEEEEMVKVVNRISGAKKLVKASEVSLFLKKHTLFELVQEYLPASASRRSRGRGRGAKASASASASKKEDQANTKASLGSKRAPPSAAAKSEGSATLQSQTTPSQPEPLILTLAEAEELMQAYSSCVSESPSSPVNWEALAVQVCGGKFSAADVRLVAEEFRPATHVRSASGMVVIERSLAGSTEIKRRRVETSLAKVEETRKSALAGAQASDAAKARALHGPAGTAQIAGPSTPVPSMVGMQPGGVKSGSAETEFVRDVLQAAQEWIQVIPTVATRDSMTMLLIKAAQATLGQ